MASDDFPAHVWDAMRPSWAGLLAWLGMATACGAAAFRLVFSAGRLAREHDATRETIRENTAQLSALRAELAGHSVRLAAIEARLTSLEKTR